ncbi:MAG: collagen-like repeat preface domain-containing protein, partial [Planctomycetes bacterium]|nr:collagen-like repeat preface domain-containing protein [Planctomycetota bacterium]
MADINITLGSGIGPQGPAGPSGTGVISVNTFTGAITLVGAGGATISAATGVSGATLTITAGSGGGGSGAVDSVNS